MITDQISSRRDEIVAGDPNSNPCPGVASSSPALASPPPLLLSSVTELNIIYVVPASHLWNEPMF